MKEVLEKLMSPQKEIELSETDLENFSEVDSKEEETHRDIDIEERTFKLTESPLYPLSYYNDPKKLVKSKTFNVKPTFITPMNDE